MTMIKRIEQDFQDYLSANPVHPAQSLKSCSNIEEKENMHGSAVKPGTLPRL